MPIRFFEMWHLCHIILSKFIYYLYWYISFDMVHGLPKSYEI